MLQKLMLYTDAGGSMAKQARDVLNTALDQGIKFLDTAACYGLSEEQVGEAVSHRRRGRHDRTATTPVAQGEQ